MGSRLVPTFLIVFSLVFPGGVLSSQNKQPDNRIARILKSMTLEEKVYLLQADEGVPRLGVPSFNMTDGARGPHGDGQPSTGFPCGVGMASAWNPGLMRQVGEVWGEETRALGKTFLLAPGCNILRDPLNGRFFEYYTEDPYLNSELTVPIVEGIQSKDVISCLKHFACNNREDNRNNYYSVIDDRTLHEIYLPAFEAAVKRAGVWSVMTSANGINYEFVSDSRKLQTDLLKDKWGFDGIIISDWLNTRSVEKGAFAGLDKSMPGGRSCGFGDPLLDAVRKGTVPESVIDEKVRRILLAYQRVGLLDPDPDISRGYVAGSPEHISVARKVAEEGMVLLKNDGGLLPLQPNKIRRILVTGPNAKLRTCEYKMGGSCWVNSPDEVTVLDGLLKSFGKDKLDYFDWFRLGGFQELGEVIDIQANYSAKDNVVPPVKRKEDKINFMWEMRSPDPSIPVEKWSEAFYNISFTPLVDGKYTFRITAGGGDVVMSDGGKEYAPMALLNTAEAEKGSTTAIIDLKKGKPCHLTVRYTRGRGDAFLHVEWQTPDSQADEASWKDLEKKARKADVVLFVGGLDLNLDTEGVDRGTLLFPDLQQEAILRLVGQNKKTVVALVNGSPLELGGWLDRIPAVLECWYGGISAGDAVADILTGKVNPSGRLPFSWPVSNEASPVARLGWENRDYVLYSDSLMVGYRYYDTVGEDPQFPFGYGLSYSTFEYGDLSVESAGDKFVGTVPVRNTGQVSAKEVVQVYVRPLSPSVSRPAHELKAFCKVDVPAGQSVNAVFSLGKEAFSYYDTHLAGWKVDPGRYVIEIGRNSRDIVTSFEVTVPENMAALK